MSEGKKPCKHGRNNNLSNCQRIGYIQLIDNYSQSKCQDFYTEVSDQIKAKEKQIKKGKPIPIIIRLTLTVFPSDRNGKDNNSELNNGQSMEFHFTCIWTTIMS